MGARGGMIAPDKKTFEYLKGKEFSPKDEEWDSAIESWRNLKSDPDYRIQYFLVENHMLL